MANPFDIVKNINDKTPIEFDISEYNPWVINRAFSNTLDTLFFANEMNKFHQLSKTTQYDFYFNVLPKKSRLGTWFKKDINIHGIELIQELYHCNKTLAEKYLSMMSDIQLQQLEEKMDKGGANGRKYKEVRSTS